MSITLFLLRYAGMAAGQLIILPKSPPHVGFLESDLVKLDITLASISDL